MPNCTFKHSLATQRNSKQS